MPPELVIFDNDGVLVDSEPLTHSVLTNMVQAVGVDMDLETALSLFKGGKMSDCVAELERRRGAPMDGDFVAEFRSRCDERYRTELQAMPGVATMISELERPYCVASNGPETKVRTTLGAVGLLPHFEGRIFSAYTRLRFKPDPDVFLQAAGTLGAAPERCVVVEDSVHGVQAARAAGMRVLGFAPPDNLGSGEGLAAELTAGGATVFHDMGELVALLNTAS